jgi:YaiO family outer membrane protein
LPETSADPLEQSARAAIERKDFAQARTLYRQLASLHPENMDYVLSIGRVSAWMEDYPAAHEAYNQVLTVQPNNVDALLGQATLFMWERQFGEAEKWLSRAEALAPTSVDVRLARARFYHYQGMEKEASAVVQSVLATEPNNAEALALSRQIELPRPVEINTGYENSRLSSLGSGGQRKFIDVGYVTPRSRVNVGYERGSRFGDISNRLYLTTSRRLQKKWAVRGGVSLAPGADTVPRQEYSVGASRNVSPRVVLGADYRYSRLSAAQIHTLAPTLEYYFKDASWLQATYYRSWTSFKNSAQPRVGDNSFAVRYNRQISAPVLLYIGYGRGRESFQTFLTPSIDRIGSFDAETYLAGVKWQFARHYWLNLYGVRQKRSTGIAETTTGISLSTRQ